MIATVGLPRTVSADVALEIHPDEASVKINVAVPAEIPCTIPELLTEATEGFRLVQVPPTVGVKVVNEPAHMEVGPEILTVGFPLTVTSAEALDIQPVLVSV